MKFDILTQIKKIKSWHIVLLGIITQLWVGYSMVSSVQITKAANSTVNITTSHIVGNMFMTVIGLFLIIGTLFGIIPLILLYFKKTRKIGGIVSIILGIVGIITQLGVIVSVFMILAGILALWKRV